MVCALYIARPSRAKEKDQRRAILLAATSWTFIAAVHFLTDLVQVLCQREGLRLGVGLVLVFHGRC